MQVSSKFFQENDRNSQLEDYQQHGQSKTEDNALSWSFHHIFLEGKGIQWCIPISI